MCHHVIHVDESAKTLILAAVFVLSEARASPSWFGSAAAFVCMCVCVYVCEMGRRRVRCVFSLLIVFERRGGL